MADRRKKEEEEEEGGDQSTTNIIVESNPATKWQPVLGTTLVVSHLLDCTLYAWTTNIQQLTKRELKEGEAMIEHTCCIPDFARNVTVSCDDTAVSYTDVSARYNLNDIPFTREWSLKAGARVGFDGAENTFQFVGYEREADSDEYTSEATTYQVKLPKFQLTKLSSRVIKCAVPASATNLKILFETPPIAWRHSYFLTLSQNERASTLSTRIQIPRNPHLHGFSTNSDSVVYYNKLHFMNATLNSTARHSIRDRQFRSVDEAGNSLFEFMAGIEPKDTTNRKLQARAPSFAMKKRGYDNSEEDAADDVGTMEMATPTSSSLVRQSAKWTFENLNMRYDSAYTLVNSQEISAKATLVLRLGSIRYDQSNSPEIYVDLSDNETQDVLQLLEPGEITVEATLGSDNTSLYRSRLDTDTKNIIIGHFTPLRIRVKRTQENLEEKSYVERITIVNSSKESHEVSLWNHAAKTAKINAKDGDAFDMPQEDRISGGLVVKSYYTAPPGKSEVLYKWFHVN